MCIGSISIVFGGSEIHLLVVYGQIQITSVEFMIWWCASAMTTMTTAAAAATGDGSIDCK